MLLRHQCLILLMLCPIGLAVADEPAEPVMTNPFENPFDNPFDGLFQGLSSPTRMIRSGEINNTVGFESHYFFEEGADLQKQFTTSVSWKGEFYFESESGKNSFTIMPFYRYDQVDEQRSHGDFRELAWTHLEDTWESTVGISRVSWGVMEFTKLVDFINQKDYFEEGSAETLGQPMASISFEDSGYIFEFYTLFGLREHAYPGQEGRLRYPYVIDEDNAEFEYGKVKGIDLAARVKTNIRSFDVAISHFYGMNRNPYFTFNFDFIEPKLIPVYEKINQTGIELQTIWRGAVLRFEGIRQVGDVEGFYAVAFGVEYAFSGIFKTDIDARLVTEITYDSRTYDSRNLFDHDIFIGGRFAFNDDSDSTLITGFLMDPIAKEATLLVSYDRYFGDNFRLRVDGSVFMLKDLGDNNQIVDDALAEALDAAENDELPNPDDEVVAAIINSFGDIQFNTRDLNSFIIFLQTVGPNNIGELDAEQISRVAADLAKVSNTNQKLSIFENDSFVRLELQYFF